jgi:hypothetical protein
VRGVSFDLAYDGINPDVGIDLEKKLDMIFHDFHLNNAIVVLILFFKDQFLDPGIDWGNKHATPIFWAKDDMVFAVVYDRPVSEQVIGEHRGILTTNICSVNPVSGKAPDGQALAPYIPPLKQVGFTGHAIILNRNNNEFNYKSLAGR